MALPEIRIEDYTYELAENRIARYPLAERDQSKLLIFTKGQISHTLFQNLDQHLLSDSLLIWNDTRVIQARLQFRKPSGSPIEIFLLEPAEPAEFSIAFSACGSCIWNVIIGNSKKWKNGPLVSTCRWKEKEIFLIATRENNEILQPQVRLTWEPSNLTFAEITDIFGHTPIPPYLNREDEESDKSRYQTVYARIDGSVAAPTAGLHFTSDTIEKIKEKRIEMIPVTLHVGAGTFIPVKAQEITGHNMHSEVVIISKKTIEKLIILDRERITAVGTTTVRSLESLYWLGVRFSSDAITTDPIPVIDQWMPYTSDSTLDAGESLLRVIQYLNSTGQDRIQFATRLIIVPGYKFRIVKRMVTNFHQPGSTLLLLIAAFTGKKWREIYQYALDHQFRFLSYGDSSLLDLEEYSQ